MSANSITSLREDLTALGAGLERVAQKMHGIDRVWTTRNSIAGPDWNEFVRGAKTVWLYGVSEYFYATDLKFLPVLREAMDRGATYKILLLNVASSVAADWDQDVKERPIGHSGVRQTKLNVAIDKFKGWTREYQALSQEKGGGVELRLYDSVPSVSIVRADERMLVTPYLSDRRGNLCPTLEIQQTPEGLFEVYVEHFQWLWERSPVSATTAPSLPVATDVADRDGAGAPGQKPWRRPNATTREP